MRDSSSGWIEVRGARTHNLKDIDVRIPRGRLVVFTGVSGSGKSSLAFDTIFAEGQRRFLETTAPFVRQLLARLPAPDVDAVVGLPPTVSVEQRAPAARRRSTVADVAELDDCFRLLFARAGEPTCPACGAPIVVQTLGEILDDVLALPDGEKIHILAPLARGAVGDLSELFDRVRRDAFLRIRLDGVLGMADAGVAVDPAKPHDLDLVVDRQVVRAAARERLAESLELALKHGDGVVTIARLDDEQNWMDRSYSTKFACPNCRAVAAELEPRLFNPASPHGACETCAGLGVERRLRWEAVALRPEVSIRAGGLAPVGAESAWSTDFRRRLATWAKSYDELDAPLNALPEDRRQELLALLGDFLDARGAEDEDDTLEIFRETIVCSACGGARLGPAGRHVRLADWTLPELLRRTATEVRTHFLDWRPPARKAPIVEPVLVEIRSRLEFLERVGVGYLELDRPVTTLSGGEAQRVRLAGCVGSPLVGACYVLDEPTAGLHARDVGKLVDVLEGLRDAGATVLAVEHDPNVMRRADWLVEIGPGAGELGGQPVACAPRAEFLHSDCLTAKYLDGREFVVSDTNASIANVDHWLEIDGATLRNLQAVDVRFPLGALTVVTGVSGSGKSTLAMEVLAPAVKNALGWPTPTSSTMTALRGVERLQRIAVVDQSPIGRSPRSTPATVLGVLEPLRRVFAQTVEAKARGYTAARFAFNAKSGQCPACKGVGAVRVDLAVLGEDFAVCETCGGSRYNPATLAIRYRGLSIADALALSIGQAAEFFANHPKIAGPLQTATSVGLGYLRLDQWATRISGGEAQRLKLAEALAKDSVERTLFLLDEPTAGLHFADTSALLGVLRKLTALGHTVIAVEHQLDFIRGADWVVDLGPEGGAGGGRILAMTTPSELAEMPTATGRALAESGVK